MKNRLVLLAAIAIVNVFRHSLLVSGTKERKRKLCACCAWRRGHNNKEHDDPRKRSPV